MNTKTILVAVGLWLAYRAFTRSATPATPLLDVNPVTPSVTTSETYALPSDYEDMSLDDLLAIV